MSTFAAWLLTYALHSTLLLGLAWALARPLGRRSPRLEEAAWRAAMLGAVATATLHLAAAGAGWTPALGSWRLAAPAGAPAEAGPAPLAERAALESRTALAPGSAAALSAAPGSAAPPALAVTAPASASNVAGPGTATPARGRELPGGLVWIALLWGAGALALLARFALAHLGLRDRLQPRLEISGGTLFRLLSRLAPQSGLARPVGLTCAYRLPVPVALGIRRPEICVPPRALSHLDPAAQETLLAHELGHLARRDPLWLNVVALLCCVLFFQPLNWLARRRLREISELLCDDWAVRRTGQPLTLARCLAEVAGWSHALGGALLPAPGMADRPSQLSRRVRRLLEDPAGLAAERALPRWLGAALVILLVAVAAVAPGVSAAAREEAGSPASAAPRAEAAPAPGARPSASAPPASPAPRPVLVPASRGLSAEDRERIRVFRERVEELTARQDLSEEEIERRAEALADELGSQLRPQIEEMTARALALAEGDELHRFAADAGALAERLAPLAAELARLVPSDEELERMIPSDEELERMIPSDEELERMIPSDAELERISAEALARSAADLDRLKDLTNQLEANGLSKEEIERIRQDARRLADAARLDAKTQADLRRVAEEMREFERTHRHEIEILRRDLLERSHGLSDEIRRELKRELEPVIPPPPPRPAPAPPSAVPPAPPAAVPPAPPAAAPRPSPGPAPAPPAPAPAPPARPGRLAAAAPPPPPAGSALPPAPAPAPAPPALAPPAAVPAPPPPAAAPAPPQEGAPPQR